MAHVAVVHYDLNKWGGGEAVCANVLQAVQEAGHEVTVFTSTRPNIERLNEYFNTDIRESTIDVHVDRRASLVAPDDRLSIIGISILNKLVKAEVEKHDVAISTSAPVFLDIPCIQYVHSPRYNQSRIQDVAGPKSVVRNLVLSAVRKFSEFDNEKLATDVVIANSEWTKSKIEETYSVDPRVIHPPVDTSGLGIVGWENMESGFVTVGRIVPSKNLLEIIDIIGDVRDRGHDVHLHIVGPNEGDNYYDRFITKVRESEFVQYEGKTDREKLVSMINAHKYGIHGREKEHFGITVAELVLGRTKTFVPDGGGQTEIVNDRKYIYDSRRDAVDKIDSVLRKSDTWDSGLSSAKSRFSTERFRNDIIKSVDSLLKSEHR